MKIKCLHGFFVFEETTSGQAGDFTRLYQRPLVPFRGAFTFEELADAPRISVKGQPWLNLVATVSFSGDPWEIMEANGWVFNLASGLLVPLTSVTIETPLTEVGSSFTAPGLIQPGSLFTEGRIVSYQCWVARNRSSWLYSEVTYV